MYCIMYVQYCKDSMYDILKIERLINRFVTYHGLSQLFGKLHKFRYIIIL